MHPETLARLTPQQANQSITWHCKAIRLTFPLFHEPDNAYMCSNCQRYDALWAYYKPDEVQFEGCVVQQAETAVETLGAFSYSLCVIRRFRQVHQFLAAKFPCLEGGYSLRYSIKSTFAHLHRHQT